MKRFMAAALAVVLTLSGVGTLTPVSANETSVEEVSYETEADRILELQKQYEEELAGYNERYIIVQEEGKECNSEEIMDAAKGAYEDSVGQRKQTDEEYQEFLENTEEVVDVQLNEKGLAVLEEYKRQKGENTDADIKVAAMGGRNNCER